MANQSGRTGFSLTRLGDSFGWMERAGGGLHGRHGGLQGHNLSAEVRDDGFYRRSREGRKASLAARGREPAHPDRAKATGKKDEDAGLRDRRDARHSTPPPCQPKSSTEEHAVSEAVSEANRTENGQLAQRTPAGTTPRATARRNARKHKMMMGFTDAVAKAAKPP